MALAETGLARGEGSIAQHRVKPIHLGVLALIVIVGALVRAHGITDGGLTFDEIGSVESSSGHGLAWRNAPEGVLISPAPDWINLAGAKPWWAVCRGEARDDSHPPLYFLLLRGWRMIFGDSAAALRSLSLVFSLIAILLLFDAMRLAWGPQVALWGSALMALAEPQVIEAQNARNYALLVMLVLAACNALVRIEQLGANRRRLAALSAAALGAMLTHYYAVAPLLGLGIYSLIALPGRLRRAVAMSFAGAAVAFCVLWGWGVWAQHNNLILNNNWLSEASSGHLARTLWRVALLPARMLAEPMKGSRWIAVGAAVIYVLPVFLWRKRRDLWLWTLIWWTTVAMLALLDAVRSTQQLQFLRYSVAASPAVYVLICALLIGQARWLRTLLPLVALIACAQAWNRVTLDGPWRPPWPPKFTSMVGTSSGPTAWVIGDMSQTAWDREIYLVLTRRMGRTPGAVMFVGQESPKAQAVRELESYRTVWLISNSTATLPAFMRGRWQSRATAALAGNVTVQQMLLVEPASRLH